MFKALSINNLLSTIKIPDFKRKPVLQFISKRSGPFDGSVSLTRDRVYIVPTRIGLIFSLLLLTLLIGSINYEKSLGFVLTFLLASAGNIALLSTWRNIAGLQIKRLINTPVFCGETATFNVQLVNHQLLNRYSLVISQNGIEQDIADCAANSNQLIKFEIHSEKRGLLDAGKFRLHTEFPGGLFVAWTWVDLSMNCLIYPAPDKHTDTCAFDISESGDIDLSGKGMENFSHLRKYQQGDNINRISWRAAAKNNELYSKEFVGSKPVTHWINWDDIVARDNEHRISIMTTLIIQAEKNQQQYGLTIPDKQIPPDSGNKHFHRCLTALALY